MRAQQIQLGGCNRRNVMGSGFGGCIDGRYVRVEDRENSIFRYLDQYLKNPTPHGARKARIYNDHLINRAKKGI